MKKSIIHTNKAPNPIGPYSQAVKAGQMVFVSGQIALDMESGQMIQDSISAETERVMNNIKAVLNRAGLEMHQIVKTSIFLKDMNDFVAVNEIYSNYFENNFPARETVEVSRLPKDARVEISVIAYDDFQ